MWFSMGKSGWKISGVKKTKWCDVSVGGLLLAGKFVTGEFVTGEYGWGLKQANLSRYWPMQQRVFSESLLARYDGTFEQNPLYLAVRDDIPPLLSHFFFARVSVLFFFERVSTSSS